MKSSLAALASVAGVGLSVLAMAGVLISSRAARVQVPAFDLSTLDERMNALEAQIAHLKARLDGESSLLATQEPSPTPAPPTEIPSDCAIEAEALAKTIEEIKAGIVAWQATVALSNDREPRRTVPTTEDLSVADTDLARRSIARYQEIFMNQNLGLDSRVRALNVLRMFPSNADAITPIADEVFHLLVYTDEEQLEEVVEVCKGTRNDSIANGLVHVLDNCESDKIRWEAVRALQGYVHLPHVVAALERAAASKPGSSQRAAREVLAIYYKANQER